MQLYDGIPIITNKMPLPERKGIPHHLLGCVSIEAEPWRVDVFTKKALGVVGAVFSMASRRRPFDLRSSLDRRDPCQGKSSHSRRRDTLLYTIIAL